MPDGSRTWEETASARKGGDGIGPKIIAKLATVPEVAPSELLRMPAAKGERADCPLMIELVVPLDQSRAGGSVSPAHPGKAIPRRPAGGGLGSSREREFWKITGSWFPLRAAETLPR
jgi:hypothetical protein